MDGENLVAWEERDEVLRRRYHEALAAGMCDQDADRFARSDTDVGLLRRCVKGGCPVALIPQVVL